MRNPTTATHQDDDDEEGTTTIKDDGGLLDKEPHYPHFSDDANDTTLNMSRDSIAPFIIPDEGDADQRRQLGAPYDVNGPVNGTIRRRWGADEGVDDKSPTGDREVVVVSEGSLAIFFTKDPLVAGGIHFVADDLVLRAPTDCA
eukprot:Polyplicarium_translucidae@DN106_c0_g1_i1.p2